MLMVEDETKMAGPGPAWSASPREWSRSGAPRGRRRCGSPRRRPYDAIVLDVMLPRIDGFEVCRRLGCERGLVARADAHGEGRGRGPGCRASTREPTTIS